ncbi:MAG: ribosome assembly cofactor RimP [Bacteroidales bacterium]|nr:ribosome assembly cofactor RimP [Bacteroidales bacterium]MBQ7984224.1 ribosome assembly cofactor RimP [Bacteroidales bacterium]
MTDSKLIEQIVNTYTQGKELFLVSVKVTKSNVITVTVDGDKGVVIDDCILLSKYIESQLDRDKEDFELTVTSFGLGEYFTMQRQYLKNVGQQLEVVLTDGTKINGKLEKAENGKLYLSTKKQKDLTPIDFSLVEKSRVVIQF